MSVTAIEGVVKNGQIQLRGNIRLPENARVYIVIPELSPKVARIFSPRLAHPEQAKDFVKEVIEERADASL